MSAKTLFDSTLVAEHDRYRCVVCGKEIRRRPKGARIAHAKMHVRKAEAYCRLGNAPYYTDEYYAGQPTSAETISPPLPAVQRQHPLRCEE